MKITVKKTKASQEYTFKVQNSRIMSTYFMRKEEIVSNVKLDILAKTRMASNNFSRSNIHIRNYL